MSRTSEVSHGAGEQIAPASDDEYFLDVDGLARLMKIAPATIYSDMSRCPWKLPPPCRPRGRRLLLWDRATAIEWIKRFEEVRFVPLTRDVFRTESARCSEKDRTPRIARVRDDSRAETQEQGRGSP